MKPLLIATLTVFSIASAQSQIFITEFFYQGQGVSPATGFEHEFVELTNVGSSSVDLTGWRYYDSGNNFSLGFDLSALGTVNPGQSVIFTDISEADFRTVWSTLDAGVVVLGGAVPGLGRNDSIIIYNAEGDIMDRLDYGDQNFAGTPRFRYTTGITSPGNLGENDISQWVFSDNAAGWFDDISPNNLTSINGDIGNPGYVNFNVVPEPSSSLLVLAAAGSLFGLFRRRRIPA